MNINLSRIPESGLNIDEEVTLKKEFYEKTEIEEIRNLHVS